jgi:hypothetical protein
MSEHAVGHTHRPRRDDRMAKIPRKTDPVRLELPQRAAGPLSVRTLIAQVPRRHGERRNHAARAQLLRRVEVEDQDMPACA